jgi:inosose dehydratase
MSDWSRREFIAAVAAVGAAAPRAFGNGATASRLEPGYSAITWGGDDDQAIDDIASVGFRGIQLRATVLEKYGAQRDALRRRLASRGLRFVVLSSGNLKFDPSAEQEQLALHTAHAGFVRDAGGAFIQVIDEKPRDRATSPDDYARLGHLMSELGRRTRAAGVPLVYHHHMKSLGQPPEAIDAILRSSDPSAVSLLLDIAHYQQGGGDPVAAIRQYRDRIRIVHLKDVRATAAAPGYEWVELGRGRVDVKGCVAALREIGFRGWAIVELDRVPEPGGSPKASAEINREYVVGELGLPL